MRALIVAAVSTVAQATEDKASIPEQLARGRQVCLSRNWTIAHELTIPGHSRNYTWLHEIMRDCPEYARLVSVIETGDINLIVCQDYDRLWRTDALRAQLTALCREHSVQIFSCNQPVEPVRPELLDATDTARLSEVLFGFISEQENRVRVRRRKLGMEARIRKGLHTPATPPYGYRRELRDGAVMEVVPEQATWVRWVYERRAEGMGQQGIVDRLNDMGVTAPGGGPWHYAAVRRMVRNDVYIGTARWGGAVQADGRHEPIIPDDLWERVQAINAHRSQQPHRGPIRELSGLVRCGHCGWGLAYTTTRCHYSYLRCNRAPHKAGCDFGLVPAYIVEEQVRAIVRQAIADPAEWLACQEEERGNAHIAARLAMLDRAIAEIEVGWQRWNDLFERGGITADEMLLHRQELRGRAEALHAEREKLRSTDLSERAAQLTSLHDTLSEYDRLSGSELRDIYVRLLRHVEVVAIPDLAVTIRWL